ncbi:MAG: TIGR04282 family arsenosugar biosynthesis glycosyltransferase [Alphaproteobacteria bacterium]|nr:TIGR04282 family arsenosugar biosynthesis glycosyltransferase [Alphaproteobacteria bacterium]
MKDLAIVFGRAPRLGTGKRRLAREIGDRAALRFHGAQLNGLLRRLGRDRRWHTILAVTPDRAFVRVPHGVTVMDQGRGDLGARMRRALACGRRAVLVGCDIPDIGPADIAAAFAALGRTDAVFGPAEDGGYWLVGLGPRRPARPFAGARWSSPDALADTLRNFVRYRVAFVRRRRDVDTLADLIATGAQPV